MYTVTISKLTLVNIWAGFNMMSELLLLGDIQKECQFYGVQFEPCEKGELKLIETTWHNYIVMIQYRRIN